MGIRLVHKEQIKNSITYKENISKGYDILYKKFYSNKYLPMQRKVKKLDFDSDKSAFLKCSDYFNKYMDAIKAFEPTVGLSINSKLHTSFLEEFSCYFITKIPEAKNFDIFKNNVFAGLMMKEDQSVSIITKDVDFCIGKEVIAKFDQQKIRLNIPIVSVEMKTYTDKTMLGEVMNTARKLKGANPKSKVLLLMWVSSLTNESVLEAYCDSAIDEIVVMSEKKRKSGIPTPTEFTELGLAEYWEVLTASIKGALMEYNMPTIGRLLSYIKSI